MRTYSHRLAWSQFIPKRAAVKPQTSPDAIPVNERLDVLLQLAAADEVSTYEQLAAWLGVPYHSLRKWTNRRMGRRTALRIAGALQRRGYTCSVEWVQNGTGMPPGRPQGERSMVSERLVVGDLDPRAQGANAASSIVGLVQDALLGAVDRALARDH